MEFALSGQEAAGLLARHVARREGLDVKAYRCHVDIQVGAIGQVEVVITFTPKPEAPPSLPVVD